MLLSSMTTESLRSLLGGARKVVALVPVGSTEPHGPHLPLSTDVLISEGACVRAIELLEREGLTALIAPSVAYGVTNFAEGFAGAVSIPAPVLSAYLGAIVDGLIATGFAHVCLVNNHLEPAHDVAVRAAIAGRETLASVACPLTRRWAKELGDEFRSGACHAGRYETSLVMAQAPTLVDAEKASGLPDLDVSLSDGIRRGIDRFSALGMERAYTGSPRGASSKEGEERFERLARMVATEVIETISRSTSVGDRSAQAGNVTNGALHGHVLARN
jgi:creatinine amidohydrolase